LDPTPRQPLSVMLSRIVLALALLAGATATVLTPDNYDELTAGKTVFIKFQAPW